MEPQPRRVPPSAHSRYSSSSSSLGAPESSPAIDTQQQYQHEPSPSLRRRSSERPESSTPMTQLTKLDGVIYHFYTTTANLIIQSRLAHLRSSLLAASSPEGAAPAQQSHTPHTKLSKWFDLHIPDTDLFKDELRLWRSVTSLLGLETGNVDPPLSPSAVPDLIIDVVLDLSNVSDRHEILLMTRAFSASSSRASDANTSRVCIDGRIPGEAPSSATSSVRPHRIVLERWQLRFDPSQPSAPPDLSTFYKRSVVHFRALFDLLSSLPSNRLAAKIESLKAAPQSRSDSIQPSHPSLSAREDIGTYDAEMNLGCRLSMTLDPREAQADPNEIDVQIPLPVEQLSTPSHNAGTTESGVDGSSVHGHYATRTLTPIATPIGHLELSVTYRRLTGYLIEDTDSLRAANDLKVDLDEDYFRAPHREVAAVATQPEPLPDASSDATRDPVSGHPMPLVTSPGQQRIGGISAARPAILGSQKSSPDTATGSEALTSQSPGNASVFSTSAPGRHSAGLSSLRRTGSTKSNVSIIGTTNPSGAPSRPVLAAALSTEPAFVVPGAVRRSSTSERRLRTLSGLSSGRPSPPVSPAAASFDLPEAGTSQPRSVSSGAFSTSGTGRSISTRTTSGFAGSATGNMGPPSSTQPRPSVSFSPSSPSPLAQQMSLQGMRTGGGFGLAPIGNQSTSSFRSVSSSSLRSSVSNTGGLAGPSLRSVFQNYVPRSQNVSIASISRTPPTSTSALGQGSYSPSILGTGMRNSSIRRNSSTSDAGSGSAFGASVSSSSAAQPQMIKRYSTNFSYRQNRDRSGVYGSSLGSEGSGSLGAGAEPSSYPRFGGAGGSLSSAYGRSWISRMEQRQGLGSGGAFARTASLEDATAAASASSASRYRTISGASASHLVGGGGFTPSPKSHEDDMDDLARLLESRPAFGASSLGKLSSLRNERRNAPGLSSTPEEGAHPRAADALADSVQSNPGQDRRSPLSGSGLRSGGLRTTNPLSRSQLDDLLNRMAESVGIVGSKESGSGTSGENVSDVATPGEVKTPIVPAAGSRPLTPAQIAATLGKGRGTAGKEAEGVAETHISRVSSPGAFASVLPGETGFRPRSAIGQQVRAYGTIAAAHTGSNLLPAAQDERNLTDAGVQASPSTAAVQPAHPDYEAEGDLMFKVDGQQDYNPEDELPGEMEMVPEGGGGAAVPRSSETALTSFAGGVEGGMGATLPVGAHREGRAHDWHATDRWERQRAQEAERRRADAEMSRNFGQEVGASTRGRGSHSPWRSSSSNMAQAMGAAGSAANAAAAGPVGFRSSSTRPLGGGASRLSGVATGLAGSSPSGTGDARRGYGVSAPSAQFHYQPRPTRPGAQSFPVSRDELFDDEVEEDDE
ncbi:Autophagy-related protein 13 [Kalmanozyma brasiliensis GHG001]|nr:Autophagy-related protein 13 [Kalmanozyma brasiliensis GHG001]EST07055.2 Autophagy-related protein 13 [Kalmanozyma brasiliensis GHG001]